MGSLMSNISTKAEAVRIISRLVDKEIQDHAKKSDEIEDIERAWFIILNNMR